MFVGFDSQNTSYSFLHCSIGICVLGWFSGWVQGMVRENKFFLVIWMIWDDISHSPYS